MNKLLILTFNFVFSTLLFSEEVEIYFPNDGPLHAIGEEKRDLQEGTWKFYYRDGQLREESNWRRGEAEGEARFFYKNGKLESEGQFKDGNLDGFWTFYFQLCIKNSII